MLKEYDIDIIHKGIQSLGYHTVYYIAHDVECREGYVDEFAAKSNPKFSILELKVTDIINAYFELLNYKEYPERYHTESLTMWIDQNMKYVKYYTVPNKELSYNNRFNPTMPSIIYGVKRNVYFHGALQDTYNDPSPIKPRYIHEPIYCNEVAWDKLNNGELNWKYKQIDNSIVGTDWYILVVPELHRAEHHLININQKTAFFLNLNDAISYKKELLA